MRRFLPICLMLTLVLQLFTCLGPLPTAEAAEALTWQIDYDQSPSSQYPNDKLADYLGFPRSELVPSGQLQLSITPDGSDAASLQATITTDQHQVQLTGQGTYGAYQDTPLLYGTFQCQADLKTPCVVYIFYYPADGQTQVTISFAERTPNAASLLFGQQYCNIQAITTQLSDRLKTVAKLPIAYQLDGQPLVLAPAPVINNNQVLVPVRQLLQALGAIVTWDGKTGTILAKKGATSLRISHANQTLQVNASNPEAFTALLLPSGATMCRLEPLANALAATVITRRDSTVCLISPETTAKEQGTFQIIFVAGRNTIIQNDTNQSYNLGGWTIIDNDLPLRESLPAAFSLPAGFLLEPGEQVQGTNDPSVQPDNHLLFAWGQDVDLIQLLQAPAVLQMMVTSLQSGDESIMLSNRGTSDIYLGNWRLVNAAGKPAFDLPDCYLPVGQTMIINGKPGEPANSNELRWPNLPAVEEAYLAEQVARAELDLQQLEEFRELYAPMTAALGLQGSDFYFYNSLSINSQLLAGTIAPFVGNVPASRALFYAKMGLLDLELQSGDRVPACYVSPDGQEAYLGAITKDGQLIAYHLRQVIESGYVTWLAEQVLPD